jgi:Adenylate and Guanylate cyclase catalytic domain
MARYFATMQEVIEQHGGTVEKFIGDAVMFVFGVPVLHEDDALRATRAAWAMSRRLTSLNEELLRDYGTTLQMRIGVDTGEVVTGTDERLATGDTVNVAARLEQVAGPGEILIIDDYRLCQSGRNLHHLRERSGTTDPWWISGDGRQRAVRWGRDGIWTPFAHASPNNDGTWTADIHLLPAYHATSLGWLLIDAGVLPSSNPTLPYAAENGVRPIRFGVSSGSPVRGQRK